MPSTSIGCGVLLLLIGIIGYVYGLATGHASVTALIPAFFGVVLVVLGLWSGSKPDLRKHLMHVAVVVALLGFLLTAGRMLMKFSELTVSAALFSQLSTAIVCLVFVVLSVRSFIAARREREAV